LQGAELIGSLTRLQQGDLGVIAGAPATLDASVLTSGTTNVVRELKSTQIGSSVDQSDALTMDIVAMLFDQIFGDKRVPYALKVLIGRLQIPVVKVAVLDKKFFSKKSHPARRMLDTLGEFALGLDENFDHHSAVYNDTHEFLVYLPPGYFTSSARYPVLYLVHGAGDTALGWATAGAANLILDSLIGARTAVPMIVVMPFNGSNNPAPVTARGGGAPPATSPFEDYMLKELIPLVDAKYRVAAGRQNRAMAGLSAGGAATYNVGVKHLELFSAFGLFSAAGGGGADFATRYASLAADPKGTNAKINVFWIGCGTEDPLNTGAKTLDAELTKLQINHTYTNRAGGHVWPVWRWALAEFAPKLFQKR
jgi:enterochelin esterase-like enzyme